MANRKVLINRHSTKPQAPSASEMFHGEIAVSHPTDLSATTIYTRNGDMMIPFASCAMTMQMIDNAITAADVTYDVKAAEGDAHVEVVSGGTEKAKVFTVSSKDVQGKAAFDAYSAATDATIKQNYNTLSGAIDDVLSIITTSITGDSIIKVQPTTSGAGAYSLSHKEATAVTGFNKLSTDTYGHVTASTAVVASDIKSLGFEDSAWTEQKITDAIEALDSAISASTAGKYLTAISIKDGKLDKIEEADIPVLSVESAGTGNVVEAITVNGHKISYTTTSVATSHDIEELSAATKSFSAGTYSEFNSAFTAINNLSADTEAADGKVFTSAKTYSDGLIAALDSSKVAADNKHYITAITIEDGKLSTIGEAEIPVLASAVTGTGNVVTDIAVNDHTITFAKDMAVASEDDLKAVSGIVDTFSAATVAEFNSAFTAIQAMDKEASAVAGQVVTTVSEADGVVSETKANVKDLQLGGYSKDTTATGDITSTDTINAALSKLENKAAAITIANADKSINVTTGTTGTDINVNIKSGEKVLAKDGAAGLYTDIDLVKITTGLPATVKERYQLLATDDSQIGVNIDVPKDSHIVSINFISDPADAHYQNLEYKYIDAEGTEQTTYVDVSSLVLEAEFASGVTVTDHIAHGVVDPASEDFLTVGGAGFKLSGVQDAIDAKVNALDVTDDAAVAGQYVAAIEQTDGVVAVKTRANVSEAVLNNYAKGTDGSAVAATDSVREAIGKLENQIDNAKAAATTKVVEGTDAGNNMTIVSATGADNSVTYTVNLTDVASKAALDAEIAARKAVDGQNGQTYAANTGANYIAAATSLNDADVKLDAAIKAEETARIAAIEALDSVGSASTTGHYLTSVTITDGKISAVGEVAVPANVVITATTSAAVDTPSAVLTGVTASGQDNHSLTFGMSNKVFSASTADEAVKVKSALAINILTSAGTTASTSTFDGHEDIVVDIPGSHDTATTEDGHYAPSTTASSLDAAAGTVLNTITLDSKKHVISAGTTDKINSASTADSADKVANALTMTDGTATQTYDGSEAKSLTFGTATSVSGRKSMSMTDAGVVDVEIIDCGEY